MPYLKNYFSPFCLLGSGVLEQQLWTCAWWPLGLRTHIMKWGSTAGMLQAPASLWLKLAECSWMSQVKLRNRKALFSFHTYGTVLQIWQFFLDVSFNNVILSQAFCLQISNSTLFTLFSLWFHLYIFPTAQIWLIFILYNSLYNSLWEFLLELVDFVFMSSSVSW